MRGSSVVFGAFLAGLGGGIAGPRLLPHLLPATTGAVDRVAGLEASITPPATPADFAVQGSAAERTPLRGGPAPEEAAHAMSARPHLPAQEVARRALKFTVSLRGGGVYGSGIVVDKHGFILTNHHVIQGLDHINATLVDGDEMEARVVDDDKDLDLALLKVDRELPVAATPADFLDAQVGDDVYALGCPRKMNFSVARGIVSYVGRKMDGHYYVQAAVPTNDGNSGGPVVNDRGEVVGVMTFILRDSQGLAFAIPLDYAYERFADVLHSDRMDVARFRKWRTERDAPAAASR